MIMSGIINTHCRFISNGFLNASIVLTAGRLLRAYSCCDLVNSRSGRGWKLCNLYYSRVALSTVSSFAPEVKEKKSIADGPSLKYFIQQHNVTSSEKDCHNFHVPEGIPYLVRTDYAGNNRRVFFETYGCQMNENDTEIAWSILKANGFQRAHDVHNSDVVLVMTCAIREGAEQKIWKRLQFLKSLKRIRQKRQSLPPMKIGILGCMAERLKTKIIDDEKMVDVVCGPDAYRDLPRLLALTESGQTAVNVLLSLDETYADVMPVRTNVNASSAFVSVMRGCDNMCSYCIVPFTRGRERSRPIESVVDEIKRLSDQGIKEVVLLGQNVNSYRDTSVLNFPGIGGTDTGSSLVTSRGFRTVYRPKLGGRRFSDLLSRVASIDREMRIRFTSPHPKDFPDELLYVIRDEPNVCRQIHLPAQSGSTRVLEAMRRGYTAETYIDLVNHIRDIIPDISLSSDFIAGFCGEMEEDHQQTLSLMRYVKYNFAFCFPYSMRQKTHASHNLADDVDDEVKRRRHQELVDVFRECAKQLNSSQIGQHQVVLIEGDSKKSGKAVVGRNEANTRVVIPKSEIPLSFNDQSCTRRMQSGDYVVVQINEASSQTLKATALYHTTLASHGTTHTVEDDMSPELYGVV